MINRGTFPFSFSIFWFFVVSLVTPIAAAELTPAQQVIEKTSSQISQALKQEIYQEDFTKAVEYVDGVVSEFIDMQKVAILVLGKNIRKSSPAQRERFKQEFQALLTRTYTRAFLEYKEWEIDFSPDRAKPDARKKIIKTQVLQPGKAPIKIDYRMILNKQGNWKVYDIIIAGISIVTNYRSTFSKEFARTGSLDSVIEMLASKNSKLRDQNS